MDPYRFALYGRSAAGKTCYLAALSMPRSAHPDGCTVTRMPLKVAAPAGNPAAQKAAKIEAEDYQRGEAALDAAEAEIAQGRQPVPTAMTDSILRYAFDVGGSGVAGGGAGRSRTVRLVDYSGELVNEKLLADPDGLAQRLEGHLAEKDGLFVLAEAPKPGANPELSQELQRLERAFVSLKERRRGLGRKLDLPVALVVNKWDRRQAATDGPPDTAESLATWLESNPPHAGLRDVLRNAVGPENVKVFAASAFGAAATDEAGHERPALDADGRLRSFGLEDPFVWAISRRQAIDAARRKRLTLASLAGAAVLLAIGLVIERYVDSGNHRWAVATLADVEEADNDVLAAAEGWFRDYSQSGFHRHLAYRWTLGKPAAAEALVATQRLRDEKAWDVVAGAASPADKSGRAEDYLKRFPAGSRTSDAERLVADWKETQRIVALDAWLDGKEQQASGLLAALGRPDPGPRILADADALKASLDEPPSPPDGDRATRTIALRRGLSEAIDDARVRGEIGTLLTAYRERLAAKDAASAGSLLYGRLDDPRVREQAAKFQAEGPAALQSRLADLEDNGRWDEADDLLKSFEREHDAWQGTWADLLRFPNANALFAKLQRSLDERHDKYLYAKLQKISTLAAADEYLAGAPLQSMKHSVKAFRDWKASRDRPYDLTLVLDGIEWGGGALDQPDNWIRIWIDPDPVLNKKGIQSRPHAQTGRLGQQPIRKKIDDRVVIKVVIIEDDWIGDNDHGQGEASPTVADLARRGGYAMKLEDPGYVQKARFHIEGLPAEPTLGDWRAD